jgi:metal-responsive CopG/Arc/MetJ family transcriptional regulator
MEDLKLVGVRLPKRMYEEAEAAARKKGQTMSAFIRLAVAEYLEQEAQKKAESKGE